MIMNLYQEQKELTHSFAGELGEPVVKQFTGIHSKAQLGGSCSTTTTEAGAGHPE
jgi:hypothetical protein